MLFANAKVPSKLSWSQYLRNNTIMYHPNAYLLKNQLHHPFWIYIKLEMVLDKRIQEHQQWCIKWHERYLYHELQLGIKWTFFWAQLYVCSTSSFLVSLLHMCSVIPLCNVFFVLVCGSYALSWKNISAKCIEFK